MLLMSIFLWIYSPMYYILLYLSPIRKQWTHYFGSPERSYVWFFIAFLWEEFEDGIVEEEAIKSQRAQSIW